MTVSTPDSRNSVATEGRTSALLAPRVLAEDRFFEASANGDTVKLAISPIVDKILGGPRGGLRGFTDGHLIGKCSRLVSMTNEDRGGYFWGQVYTFTFRVFPECPVGTFHICELSRDRLETILNLSVMTDALPPAGPRES